MPRNIVVLGSTGSIGRQTLEVAAQHPGMVTVYGLSAYGNVSLLEEQITALRPSMAAISGSVPWGSKHPATELLRGEQGVIDMVTQDGVDLVVVGTAGAGGLAPTLAALRAGKLVALANKETLVTAGSVIRRELSTGHGELIPIDSEHSAIWQCLQGESISSVEALTLTASGGALRDLTDAELRVVTPEQALRHPTWSMGRKITVDSANLMNKGLEIIEAQWLFDIAIDRIEVVLHPQSVVHSLVHFKDSSVKAQLGLPDMRLPIQYALSHPERWHTDFPRLDIGSLGRLDFSHVDINKYPALALALRAGNEGGTYPAVLSAGDEVAVDAFLQGSIRFTDIPRVVERVLDRHESCRFPDLEDILEADRWARAMSAGFVATLQERA